LILGYTFALFPGFHGAFAFYAAGYQALGSVAGDARPVVSELVERQRAYHDALMVLIAVTATVGSLWFVVAAAFFRTRYRRWMSIASPILVPLSMPIGQALPAPIGGYIRPVLGTAIFTLFFLLATVVTWNPSEPARQRAASG
jgi:hypothetical protein